MKSIKIILSIFLAAILFHGCDYVRNAQKTFTVKKPGDRKILIEDYTGHKCGNCPAAARELKRLDSIYKGQIVPIAVHAGFYANVTPPTAVPPYTTNLKSQAGTDYDNTFGNSAAGNPNGLVSRVGFGKASFIEQWSSWSSTVGTLNEDSAAFNISITNSYNSSSNQVTSRVRCKATRLKSGTFNLVVLMTEDSIFAEQIDYSLPGCCQYITNYQFNHVLRGAINSSWGDPILTAGTFNKNDSIVKIYSNFQLSASWKYKHCKIIAYVYDADASSPTHYEVLQVESKDVW
ncbi:MAG TPA: Omp28-related outer membrane protein [Bacteroidia bacterium]|jgi:hypothetical protein|nr:Omp28-related outer membrane protein [Bacteroidia bacterium]